MPINKKRDYPPNWDEIAKGIKQAANWQCEWCQAPHMQVIQRKPKVPGKPATMPDWVAVELVYNEALQGYESTTNLKWSRLQYYGLTRVVLTVAHLDRDTKNNDPTNLAALCQRCHLNHDREQHTAARQYGRNHTESHQLKLITT